MTKYYDFISNTNERLDDFVKQQLSDLAEFKGLELSNSKIRRLVVSGSVSVNNRVINRPAFELRGKSKVSIAFDKDKFFFEKQPDDIKYELIPEDVVYEDDYLIIVNKPAFFPVEQTITGNRDNLHDAVVRYLWNKKPELRNPPYVGIMHRLDRETSGVILFTKQRSVNKDIHDMMEKHDFTKRYIALAIPSDKKCNDFCNGKRWTVEKFIGRVSAKSQTAKWGSLSEAKGGLYSKTDFEVAGAVKKDNVNCLIIKADLYTGRTHQIRVHLSESGLPLLGDTLYGGVSAERIMLHAFSMEFVHPVSKESLTVKAPCPFYTADI